MTNRRRGGVLFGLLISALILVCITMAVGFWVARNFDVKTEDGGHNENVSIHTPVGDLDVQAHKDPLDPASIGIPVYPGARRRERKGHGGGAVVEWTSRDGSDGGGISVSAVELVTPDPADKVFAYYREQFPDWIEKKENRSERELHDKADKRHVAVTEKADGTHIGIASVEEPPAN